MLSHRWPVYKNTARCLPSLPRFTFDSEWGNYISVRAWMGFPKHHTRPVHALGLQSALPPTSRWSACTSLNNEYVPKCVRTSPSDLLHSLFSFCQISVRRKAVTNWPHIKNPNLEDEIACIMQTVTFIPRRSERQSPPPPKFLTELIGGEAQWFKNFIALAAGRSNRWGWPSLNLSNHSFTPPCHGRVDFCSWLG